MVNLAILVNLVLQVNLASLAKLVNLAQQPCALINFPVSFFSLLLPPCYFLPYCFLLPPCYITPFSFLPYSFLLPTLLLSPSSLLLYYFLLTTLLLPPYYLLLSPYYFPFYLEKATTPSPFIPSISMRRGWLKRTCRTYCVSSMAGIASRISLRKRPSGMFVSIVK